MHFSQPCMLLPVEHTSFCLLGEIQNSPEFDPTLLTNLFYFIYTISALLLRYMVIPASVFMLLLFFGLDYPLFPSLCIQIMLSRARLILC